MKKSRLFLVAVLFSSISSAQQYTKIPIDSNYFWKQASTCGYHYQIRYYKDTLVSGNLYNKYTLFGGTSGALPCTASFIKNGFLRQDTLAKKVFILDAAFIERPLYNFSKTSGDTLLIYDRSSNSNITYTVQSVNAGTQTLTDNLGLMQLVSQGIGSHEGGLYASRQSYIAPQKTEKLICAGRINPYQITSAPEVGFESQCFLSTGIQTPKNVSGISLNCYPNPFHQVLNLQIESVAGGPFTIKLSNTMGQLLMTAKNADPMQAYQLSFLTNGIYFLTIQDKQQQQVFKIVKE